MIHVYLIMKKFLLSFILFASSISMYAQSEIPTDTIPFTLNDNYKEYGEFLLDMSLFSLAPPEVPAVNLKLMDASKDYSQIFGLNKNVSYTSVTMTDFGTLSPFFSGFNSYGETVNMQAKTVTLKNGMRLTTYGQYNSDGYWMPTTGGMPWNRNNFKGGFELKSSNGAFGIKVEVQQGRRDPLY